MDVEKIVLRGYIGRKIFDDVKTYNTGYKVYAFHPNNDCKHLVELNQYGAITINGKMPDLIEAKEYIITCVLDTRNNKYSNSYQLINITCDREETISIDETTSFLSKLNLKQSVVKNIIEKYPNIIELIINDRVNEIDISQIKGIGVKKLNKIVEKVNENYRFFDIMTEYADMGLTMKMVQALYDKYTNIEMVRKAMDTNPYECLCSIARVGFKTADSRIIAKNESLKHSEFRMKECIRYLVQENQLKGNTWINIAELHNQAMNTTPECIRYFATVLKEDEKIYFNQETKRVGFKKAYVCEFEIAHRIYQLLSHKKNYNFDVSKYTKSRDGFDLSKKQQEILPLLNEHSVCILMGYAGTGKAQPLDSKILSEDGWDTMSDMYVGKKIYGEDGKLHSVIGVYPQGEKDVYEVVFSDGTKTECCKEHLWTIQKPQDRKTGKYRTMSLEEIMKSELYQTNSRGDKRWMNYIPMTKPIEYDYKNVPINPYILGVLIGDGDICSKRGSIGITIYEDDMLKKIETILNESGFSLVEHGNDSRKMFRINDNIGNKNGKRRNRLKAKLEKLSLLGLKSEQKYIPKEYLFNSIEIRLELLKGLIDTDGEVYNETYNYSTTSQQLAKDITFLVQSLGGTSKIEERQTYYMYNGEKKAGLPSYRLHIKMPKNIIAFSSEKHKSRYKVGQTEARRTIREINYVGKKECQCIMVDNPSHLYLTNDLIVTHNTTSTKAVVDMLDDNGKSVMLLAPTGRASKVLANMTEKEASTIHRGLKLGAKKLELNSNNPIKEQFVVCDESSMIDIWLMRSLLRAINPQTTTLLFVCDPAQLASVGCGNVISDIIQSGVVPTVFLDEVFRYGEGGLSYVATEIREGRKYLDTLTTTSKITNFGKNNDYSFIKCDKEETLGMLMNLYPKLIRSGMDVNDVTVLSAYNKGELGTYNLNNLIQSIVNPAIEEDTFTREVDGVKIAFREGDRVIQINNNYKANIYIEDRESLEEMDERPTTKIFNGDDGVVKMITGDLLVVDFYGELVEYEKKDLKNLLLGYAISVHKSQGSTFDNAVVVTPISHKFFTKRNLLYVAMTRARKRVFHIGDIGTINYALKQSENILRNTFLYDLLKVSDLESYRIEYKENDDSQDNNNEDDY